ncbi:MAG: hypothetical protein IPM51_10770 [Sphingobacteriaceae bacterium]|nr:hypothetical protein [Sphingobacteriaceae bacterium]
MKLFEEFKSSTAQDWENKILKDLKLSSLNDLIKNQNGIKIHPFYTAEHSAYSPINTRSEQGWETCETIIVRDEKAANKQALNALSGGVSGLIFEIHKKTDLNTLLKNIELENIYTQFNISNDSLYVLDELQKKYLYKNQFNSRTTCYINIDPLRLALQFGEWHKNEEADLKITKQLKHISVQASIYKEGGANRITELALALAHLNEYLNNIDDKILKNYQKIHVQFSIDGDFFGEIAKLRAFRLLVSFLLEQYKIEIPLHMHAQTARINKSTMDANTNLLRTTTEAMSAILGGSDSISVHPYFTNTELTEEFSNRIARNQLLILKEESYLGVVSDAASGSYYLDAYTKQMAEAAWKLFQQIEKEGGFLKGIKNNTVQDLIENDANQQLIEVNEGKKTLIGVNKYLNKNEGTLKTELSKPENTEGIIKRVLPIRLAKSIENGKNATPVK